MTKEEIFDLQKLKSEYKKFKDKYNLPEFSQLNELFDIEEIDTESDFLLRKVRRTIADRVSGYLRFIEVILNPSNAPMFFFKLVKKLDSKDKEVLTGIYESLSGYEVEMIALDLDYSEKNEAMFIKKSYESFNKEIRTNLLSVIKKLGNHDDNSKKENNGSYFG